MTERSITPVQVRWSDIDMYQHVNHATMVTILEEARVPFLHEPSETGMDPTYALRSATRQYRTTPLRALWQHAPYFHDGSAPDLPAVVDHYDRVLGLNLTAEQKCDLVEYLKSL